MKNPALKKPLKNPVIITANLVLKGHSVYLTANATWTQSISDAAIAHDRDQEAMLLNLAQPFIDSQYILGVYAFPIHIKNGKVTPVTMREIIRANLAPTITPNGLTEKPEWQNEYTIANTKPKTNAYVGV